MTSTNYNSNVDAACQWSLDALYKGFDDKAYVKDCEKFSQLIDEYISALEPIERGERTFNVEALCEFIKREEELWLIGKDLHEFTYLRSAVDAGDKQALSAMASLRKGYGKMARPSLFVRRCTAGLELTEDDFAASPLLADYRFVIGQMRLEGAHQGSSDAEDVFARMQGCAGDAWIDLRSSLVGFATAQLDGKELTLTELRNLARSTDAETRKKAFDAEIECSKAISVGVAASLNGIKEQVILQSEMRGFSSPLDMALFQSRMRSETLDVLWEVVSEHLPTLQAYLKRKAEILGHENGLPWWDFFAPVVSESSDAPSFTIESARAYLVKHLGSFSSELGKLIGRAFDERWIDFDPRPGKSGGAFCRNLSNQRQSRVLTNFDGTLRAVDTIAHELGHAFHGQQIETKRPLNRCYTMPVAETASNFDELVLMSAAIEEAKTTEERIALLDARLSDVAQTVCDIFSRFLFEKSVFEQRAEKYLVAEDLCRLMEDAQKRAYGSALDPDALHPYMWVNKVHYYMTTLSYYNFPYTFGLLLAHGLYARYQEVGPSFVECYKAFLSATTTDTVEGATAVAGVDVTTREFWESSFEVIEAQVAEFLALTE